MNHGLTLTSLMVAVALSGMLAVAGTRLVVNQMTGLRVMELRDKGDSIFKFYSNLLHDDKVWWCTLYDGDPNTSTPNSDLRNCVLKGSCSGGEQPMRLMGPNCTIKFKANGERDFSAGKFTPGTELIGSAGKTLKDSVMEPASGGWWEVKVAWEHRGSAAVDLILTQTFNESLWQNAPSTGKRYLPKLQAGSGSGLKLRVRRSANYVPGSADVHKAVTAINLHTASRTVHQHDYRLVDTTTTGVGNCHLRDPKGQVVKSVGDVNACSGNRVAVKPTNCGADNSVIDRIGMGTDVTAANNVKCALDGSGKMVRYETCGRRPHRDDCTVHGQTFSSPLWGNRWVDGAITMIDSNGNLVCKGLPSWPTIAPRSITAPPSPYYPRHNHPTSYTVYGQGPIGPKGYPGLGPQGPPGYAWDDAKCS